MRTCPKCKNDSIYFTGRLKGNTQLELACRKCSYVEWVEFASLTPDEQEESRRKKRGTGSTRLLPPRALIDPQKAVSQTTVKPPAVKSKKAVKGKGLAKAVKTDPVVTAIRDIFRNKLGTKLSGYVQREGQVELALRMADVLKLSTILVSEAGVGTGKSLAYLGAIMAAVPNNTAGPVVISTKTISLQEQLVNKDVPLAKKIGLKRKPFLTKGQSHYLCRLRLHKANISSDITAIRKWVRKHGISRYGDETAVCPVSKDVWEMVNVRECSGKDCAYHVDGTCGFILHRHDRYNIQSGLIICNHNLLIDDLMARGKPNSSGLWPMPSAVVIDEAHGLESSCRAEMSQEISTASINAIAESIHFSPDVMRVIGSLTNVDFAVELMRSLEILTGRIKVYKETTVPDENGCFYIPSTEDILVAANKMIELFRTMDATFDMATGYGITQKDSRSLAKAIRKIRRIIGKMDAWMKTPENYYLSARFSGPNSDIVLTVAPIDVSGFLKANLWSRHIPVVLTSGTLAVKESFDLVKHNLGLEGNIRLREFVGDQAIGANNLAYYIPSDLPKPRYTEDADEDFVFEMARRIADLLKITSGRALVLFTSYRRMNRVYNLLAERRDLPWTKLKQGQGSQGQILSRFRDDENSVLFATGSFWEGIDVAGQSLSMVIIDKLPFPSPDDPLVKARMNDTIEEEGRFENIFLSEMLLRLKQGVGRLIRTEKDWGIVALLDVRASKTFDGRRNYAQDLERTLPKGPVFAGLGELADWYAGEERRRRGKHLVSGGA